MNAEQETAGHPVSAPCLYCCAEIPAGAKKCRFCGEWQKSALRGAANTKDAWEKLEVIGKIIGLLLIPIVLALLANSVNTALKASDVDLEMVNLAVGILQADPTERTKELRTWAISVINEHARVKIEGNAKEELLTRPLPTGNPSSLKRTLYRETSQFVAHLTGQSEVPLEKSPEVIRFWDLYGRDLIGVESQEVATKMIAFGSELKTLYGKVPSDKLIELGAKVIEQIRNELAVTEATQQNN